MSVPFFPNAVCDTALCRIAEGDHEALSVIYEKLGRQIYMLAYSILQDTYGAEDIMQETFLKLLSNAGSYQRGTNAKAYILKITQNLSLTALEKKRRACVRECPVDESLPDPDAPPLTALEALKLLNEEERQIVVMKLDSKATHKQIASLLGISTAACEKRYRRALEKLKSYYRD